MRATPPLRAAVLLLAAIVSGLTPFPAVAQVPERHEHAGGHGEALGLVEFENSGAAAAQPAFTRGLALLHSFEYDEAAAAFREAQQADPDFAVAYWMEALSYSHPLWGEDAPERAAAVLSRLGPTPEPRLARAGSARERAYGAAIEAYYLDGDHATRAHAFADSMRSLVAQYPDDIDAAAFAALALMAYEYVGSPSAADRAALRTDAIDLAERVFRTSPQHPGGTHYLIHATDDPAYAVRGLEAARSYAATAPDAEHALHMPSHIFLQLGMWDEVVSTNERAWAASRAEVAKRGLRNTDLSFHALQWLQYGYLQQGRYGAAAAVIDTAHAVLAGLDLQHEVDARVTTGWLEFALAAHAVERVDARSAPWTGVVCERAAAFTPAGPPSSERDRYMQLSETYRAVVASAACDADDNAAANAVRARITNAAASQPGTQLLRLALTHADAITAMLRGDDAAAIELLEPLSDGSALVGPPGTLRTHELLGNALLREGRAREAAAVFSRSLELTPGRVNSLLGLARASRAAGDEATARATYEALQSAWHAADRDALDRVR